MKLLFSNLKNYWCYLAIMLVILTPYLSHADKIDIAAYKMPILIENDNEGLLVKLIKNIGIRAKIGINFKLLEKNNIAQAFSKNIAIMTRDQSDLGLSGYASRKIFTKKIFVFYKKNTKPIVNLYNLKDRDVAMTFDSATDYNLMETLKRNNVRIRKTATIATVMRNLFKGRVNAIIMEEYSGLAAMKNINYIAVKYQANSPIMKNNINIIFPKNDMGKKQSIRFNKALQSMHEDGSYKKYFYNAYRMAIYNKS